MLSPRLHLAKGVGGSALSLSAPQYPSCPQEAHRHTLLLRSWWRGAAGVVNARSHSVPASASSQLSREESGGGEGWHSLWEKRRASHLGFDFRDQPGHPPLPPGLPATPDSEAMLSPEHNSFSSSERYLWLKMGWRAREPEAPSKLGKRLDAWGSASWGPKAWHVGPWCFHSCLVTDRKNVSLLFGLCHLAVSGRSEALKLFGGGGKGNASVENSPSESGAALPSRAQGHPGCLFLLFCFKIHF